MISVFFFTAAAEADLANAVLWYEAQQEGLSVEFEGELARVLTRIGQRPLQFPTIGGGVRRAMLKRFPYAVLFRADDHGILVLAVFHSRQDPQIWRSRL